MVNGELGEDTKRGTEKKIIRVWELRSPLVEELKEAVECGSLELVNFLTRAVISLVVVG